MKKEAFIESMAAQHDLTKKKAKDIFDSVFDTIRMELAAGEKVAIPGFGSFDVRSRAARKGRNPQTGEEIDIPASKTVGFKPAAGLKDAL